MKANNITAKKTTNKKETAYVTKRVLLRASFKAVRLASTKAMRLAGHVVKVQDGWVVRENEDGTIERILKLTPKVKPQEIILD